MPWMENRMQGRSRLRKLFHVIVLFAPALLLSGCRNPTTINVGPIPITASIDTWIRIATIAAILLFLLVCLLLFLVIRWVRRMWQTRRLPDIQEHRYE